LAHDSEFLAHSNLDPLLCAFHEAENHGEESMVEHRCSHHVGQEVRRQRKSGV
jgi:hypothetical protein